MNITTSAKLITVAAIILLATASLAEEATPGYNHQIPEEILTPNKVETSIGTLEFFDGLPDSKTVDKVYDNLLLMRGIETFLNGVPAASIEAIREGNVSLGAVNSNQVIMLENLLDSSPLFLTGNTDTVYASAFLNLEKDGPTVVEIPPTCGPGTINDAYFRFVTDMGGPGPDRGKGGKYLILPPDYEGNLQGEIGSKSAEVDGVDYYVSQSRSYVNWVILRGFLVDGKPDAAAKMFRQGLKIYPLAKSTNPPNMEFINGSNKSWNTIHANTFKFYHELNSAIQREPVSFLDPETRGLFASIGIQKGKPFAPDDKNTNILKEAVAIGNATARAIAFRPRLEGSEYYEGSGWMTAFVGGDYKWLKDEGSGGLNFDARTLFFYQATVNTPAMVLKKPGVGSQYAYNATDSVGNYLDGAKSYRLTIPGNVPAKDFWSIVVYDPQTRSELQTAQPYPSKNNKRDKLIVNDDGSVTLYFGPEAPAGKEANWIQTVSGKSWYTLLRLYGPLEKWFDKTWRPGEIEPSE